MKKDIIQALTEAATNSLGEIVSLKETCKQHEWTITDLNKKTAELTLDINKYQSENANLSEEVNHLHKELNMHEELVNKLETENKTLTATITKLKKTKTTKKRKAAKQS